jgi:hypothetical protein
MSKLNNMMKHAFVRLCVRLVSAGSVLLLPSGARLDAQVFQRLQVPVFSNDTPLENPWAGGLNAPQWSMADLNGDGAADLYLYDRNGSVHLAFAQTGQGPGGPTYSFAPQLVAAFPLCRNFALLRDYNRDGVPDLFAHAGDEGLPGIKVYRGHFVGNQLQFERIAFPQWFFDVIPIFISGGFTNIPVNPPDLPAIDDLDGDGDLDILGLNSAGSKVNYYQNTALEQGYTDDTLILKLQDDCWGQFYIEPFAQSLTMSDDPTECVFGFQDPLAEDTRNGGLHGGATLCTFDMDQDGDKEVLYGDLIYPHLILGMNGGNTAVAWVNEQDSTFPKQDVPVEIYDFPAAYYLDADQDGQRDILVSPNKKDGSLDREVAWFYRNIQTDENPQFERQQKDWLVETMLDWGTGAQPAFVDENGDGLLDIVVGNINRWLPGFQNDPFLVLLRNTGTAESPVFEVVSENWLNFKQFAATSFGFAPAFGDLDQDGDLDLLVGERYGSLFYAENTAGPDQPMTFGPIQPQWKNVNVGQYATPFIHDLNQDGLADLVIGERIGNLNFFPNIGTVGSPEFHSDPDEAPNNRYLGEINTQAPGYVTGYSAPAVVECDGRMLLATGSEQGKISVYEVLADSLTGGGFPLLLSAEGQVKEGEIVRPAFGDLVSGNGLLEMLVGNYRGGLGLYAAPLDLGCLVPAKAVSDAGDPVLVVFPNPVAGRLHVRLPEAWSDSADSYRIFDVTGRLSASGPLSDLDGGLDVSALPAGVYWLSVGPSRVPLRAKFIRS